MYQTLPAFFKKTAYKDPVDELHASFQDAFQTELPVFAWFASHPNHLAPFNEYMKLRRRPTVSWLTVYPVLDQVKTWDSERAVFVNIGGGVGHQCAEFKQKFPDVPGKVILQDLPHSIAAALPTPGVENMVHDFFEPQPVRGKRPREKQEYLYILIVTIDRCQILPATGCAAQSPATQGPQATRKHKVSHVRGIGIAHRRDDISRVRTALRRGVN
jgi:hypothetical protein